MSIDLDYIDYTMNPKQWKQVAYLLGGLKTEGMDTLRFITHSLDSQRYNMIYYSQAKRIREV